MEVDSITRSPHDPYLYPYLSSSITQHSRHGLLSRHNHYLLYSAHCTSVGPSGRHLLQNSNQHAVHRIGKFKYRVEADVIDTYLPSQAQPPTPILQSLQVADFTSQGSSSLVVAKPDRVEVWDVGPSGLVFQADLEVWGSVVGIEKVITRVYSPLRVESD